MKLVVLCPHFEPDTAPTGAVMTRLVHELATRGHELHVVTALPWYRRHQIEPGWTGRWVRRETTPFGSVTRVHPFPGRDRRHIWRRALGFGGFCLLAGGQAVRVSRRADAVLVMSPPLPLGVVGRAVGLVRRAPMVFNVQDVFPDAAVETGAITTGPVIRAAHWLERLTYRSAAAVTVLSEDLAANVRAKLPPRRRARVHVIPNFVDTDAIRPGGRMTAYREELGIGDEPVVMYAGNVGLSQSLELVVEAARRLPEATFVVNGDGAGRPRLEQLAAGLGNVRFGDFQPAERLPEVLATGDVHVVPLRAGLGRVSVPSKTYSILAAGRPIVASIDAGTEVPRILAESGAGVAVEPERVDLFADALAGMVGDEARRRRCGEAGRRWVEGHASPASVAEQYETLLRGMRRHPR